MLSKFLKLLILSRKMQLKTRVSWKIGLFSKWNNCAFAENKYDFALKETLSWERLKAVQDKDIHAASVEIYPVNSVRF